MKINIRNKINECDYLGTKNIFKDKECVVIACGSSLLDIDAESLKNTLRDKIVFCIKQSFVLYSDFCDVHFINFCNFQDYKVGEEVVSCLTWWNDNQMKNHKEVFDRSDIRFKIGERTPLAVSDLATLLNLEGFSDHFLLSGKCDERVSKGPGIMFEAVIPLAIWLGFKEITTFGWDIGDNKNSNQHFYNNEKNITNNIKYKAGCTLGETDKILKAIPAITKVLKERDMKVNIISDINPVKDNDVFKNMTFDKWKEVNGCKR